MATTISKIEKDIEMTKSLKMLTGSYNEIAAIKLNRIRKNIERNIEFAKELGQLTALVKKEAARRQLKEIMANHRLGTAYLIITSNDRFYGSLERSVLRYFQSSMEKLSLSSSPPPKLIMVVGKTGLSYLQAHQFNYPISKMILKHDLPNQAELQTLSQYLTVYQNVLVYHSEFRTVLSQIPTISDVSLNVQQNLEKVTIHHIFEPEIKEILQFFDSQITSLLIEQTFLEAEIARTSSRLVTMDQAERKSDEALKRQEQILTVVKRVANNSKMLEAILPKIYGYY